MVNLTVYVRPQRGYTFAGAVREVTAVDSSLRLEQLLSDLKLNKKGTALYSSLSGVELPLNSSLASHNVQDGDILETCSSPLLSAVLSAVISDLEAVQKVLPEEERTRERIQPLLDNVSLDEDDDDWIPARWSFDDVKRRGICLKMMKQVLQRNGRFANLQVPQCNDLHSLHQFMKNTVFNTAGHHHTMQQCFKPSAGNRNGKPSVCWALLQHKLDKFVQMAATYDATTSSGAVDLIEAFVKAENERQGAVVGQGVLGDNGGTPIVATNHPNQQQQRAPPQAAATRSVPLRRRPQRRLPAPAADDLQQQNNANQFNNCPSCKSAPAACMCLDASCPFEKQPCCFGCFGINHPIISLRGEHERVSLDDTRAKAVLKKKKQTGGKPYCPEYASGPFAILCTLYEAMQQNAYGNRQLSLTEKRLKELAQPRCRANLYDRQARGRSAFACIEKLTSDGLVRKEIIPGREREEESAKYSLLPDGERLAKFCLTFEGAFKSVVQNSDMIRDRSAALGGGDDVAVIANNNDNKVSIVVDSREDKTFAERLTNRCQANGIGYIRRDLPAGDYLFTTRIRKDGSEVEMVLPLVIERKTWSDLADSVLGRGQRRLDCVKIGRQTGMLCDLRHCQLCRMKRSQCPRIMFVIEGARCLSRDGQEAKCSTTKRCKYCTELQERHGPRLIQQELEKVIYRLQVEHNCLVHFTRDYNETIKSLFLLREILGSGIEDGVSDQDDEMARALALSRTEAGVSNARTISFELELTYQQFCSNARRSGDDENSYRVPPRGTIVEWTDEKFIKNVYAGKAGERLSQEFALTVGNKPAAAAVHVVDLSESFSAERTAEAVESEDEEDEEDMNESQESIQVFEDGEWASAKPRAVSKTASDTIDVDAEEEEEDGFPESQDSVQVLEHLSEQSGPSTKSTSRKRRRLETGKSDDASKKMRAGGPASRANRGTFPQTSIDSSRTPLFLLVGLYEYDQQYHSDANKVWKQLYLENVNRETDFGNLAKHQLHQMQRNEIPFVERETILFWILFLQLRYGVIVHAARQSACASELRARWGEPIQDQADGMGRALSRDRVSSSAQTPESERPSCVICKEQLGRSNVRALPCAHSFHSSCLEQWFAMKQARLCPVCKYHDGTAQSRSLRDDGIPVSTATHVASHSVTTVREARLRRFGGLPPAGPTFASRAAGIDRSHEATNGTWACRKCTYENDAARSICQMCSVCSKCTFENVAGSCLCQMCQIPPSDQIERPSRNGCSNGLSGVGSRQWTCSKCSLENDMGLHSCDACGSRNPFRVDEEHVSSHATPTAYARRPEADPTPTGGTAGKPVTCGACRLTGHNRGSATPANCPAYYSESEVKLRRKKKEDAERKRREASQRIEQLQQEEGNFNKRMRQAELAVAELRRSQANRSSMTQNELRRLNKEKERAEKRARKLG